MHVFNQPSLTEARYCFSKETSCGPRLLASVGLQCPKCPPSGNSPALPEVARLRSSQEHAF